jgi:two-component system, LuxR family, sensor kinase FixL
MSRGDPSWRRVRTLLNYGIVVLSVLMALFITWGMELYFESFLRSPLFMSAVMFSTWYGGFMPGMVAIVLSILALDYYYMPPPYILKLGISNLPPLVVFSLSALFVSWITARQQRADHTVRRVRDELEVTVQERTAALRRTNEELQAEIAERKRAEEALRRQANVLEQTYDAIFAWEFPSTIISWNRGAEQLYGFSRAEAIGRLSHKLLQTEHPMPTPLFEATLERERAWTGELTHTTRDGRKIIVENRQVLMHEADGRRLVLETNRDITERKQAEEVLRQTQAELAHVSRVMTMGELTASIAHDVNQPLTAVINNGNACLRWLARESPDLREVQGTLSDIISAGQRASDVIARIRALLKKAPTQAVPLDINEVIGEAVGLVHREVQRQRVRLRAELAADLPPELGDRVQLQQVLLNLFLNGVEAMSTVVDRPRELLIRSRRAVSDGVHVAVQDSGIGLAPQTLEQIFNAFFSTKPAGMGMGLPIGCTIIKAHGGQLWAECNPVHGATFQFTLPEAREIQDD